MKILSNLKYKFEQWLLSDTLGNQNMTNVNDLNNEFIANFGIHQLCLLEMFDKESKIFYSPKTAGFGVIVKVTELNLDRLSTLASLSEFIQQGYGLMLSSFQHYLGGEDKIYISVSCEADFSQEEAIQKLLSIKKQIMDRLQESFEHIEEMTAESMVDYLIRIFNPELSIKQRQNYRYNEELFVKDQLVLEKEGFSLQKTGIEVKKEFIEFTKGDYVCRNIGYAVQRYFSHEANFEESMYLERLMLKPTIFEGVIHTTMGFFYPLPIDAKLKKDKVTRELKFRQKLQVYHVMNCCIAGDVDDIEEKTKEAMSAFEAYMESMNYQVMTVNNKQLSTLFYSIPTNLNQQLIDDIYSLRLSTSVEKLLVHDVLPVAYNVHNPIIPIMEIQDGEETI